jgi:hypothetical protein
VGSFTRHRWTNGDTDTDEEIDAIDDMLVRAKEIGVLQGIVWLFGKHMAAGKSVVAAAMAAVEEWDK